MTINEQLDSIIEQLDHDKLHGKKILITGACGFLGSWFTAIFQRFNEKYTERPVRVTGIDTFIATDSENYIVELKDPHIQLFRYDAAQFAPIERYDMIIHAAGIASPIYYRKYPIQTIDGMVLGLSNLLKLAVEQQPEHFLYFSSSEMYGNPHKDAVPTPESYNGNVSATGPRSCYDESKRLGESMCVAYYQTHGVPVNWVRPFNVYGPGMRVNDDRVVPKFIFQGLKEKPLTVHVPGVQTRTFCYVTDAMTGFMKALLSDKKGEVYNIGNEGPEMTIDGLAKMMNTSLFHRSLEIQEIEMPQEYPQDQAQRRCPDISKARELLNYEPQVSLLDGLKMTYEWCKTQPYR